MLPTSTIFMTPRERLYATAACINGMIVVALLFWRPLPAADTLDIPVTSINSVDVATAQYVDLTHTVEPGMPLWGAFAQPAFGAAKAANRMEGLIESGEEFTYAEQGFIAGSYSVHTDQIGTQLDVPAHWNEWGATLSDLPPTVALRKLCVIDITQKVASDPGYHAQVDDVLEWEQTHGRVPPGSAVFFRSDWGRKWAEYAASGAMPDVFPGVSLAALKFLHNGRSILLHGHEPLDTDMTPSLEGEAWLMHHNFMQVEGVANLHLLPPAGCLVSIGFPKLAGAVGGMARLIAICPPDTAQHGVTIAAEPGAPLAQQPFPLRRGSDGVLRPRPGAAPTDYCMDGVGALGCPLPS